MLLSYLMLTIPVSQLADKHPSSPWILPVFSGPLIMSSKCMNSLSPAVTVSSTLVPSLTEFPSMSLPLLQFRSSYFCLSLSFASLTHLSQHAWPALLSLSLSNYRYLRLIKKLLSSSCFVWIFPITAQCFPSHNSFHNMAPPPSSAQMLLFPLLAATVMKCEMLRSNSSSKM